MRGKDESICDGVCNGMCVYVGGSRVAIEERGIDVAPGPRPTHPLRRRGCCENKGVGATGVLRCSQKRNSFKSNPRGDESKLSAQTIKRSEV